MLSAHLPALQVVIPLVSAPVCLLLRNPRHAWACALSVSWMVLAIAIMLAQQVAGHGDNLLCHRCLGNALGDRVPD